MKKIICLLSLLFFQAQFCFAGDLTDKDCQQVSKEVELIFQSLKTNFQGVSPDQKDQIKNVLAETLIPYMDFESALRFTMKRDFKKLKKIKDKELREEIIEKYKQALHSFSLKAMTNLLSRKREILEGLHNTEEIKVAECAKKDVTINIDQAARVRLRIQKVKDGFRARNIIFTDRLSGVSVHTGKILNLQYKSATKKGYTFEDAYKAF